MSRNGKVTDGILKKNAAGLSLEGIDALFVDGKVIMRRSPRDMISFSAEDTQRSVEKNRAEKDSHMEHSINRV